MRGAEAWTVRSGGARVNGSANDYGTTLVFSSDRPGGSAGTDLYLNSRDHMSKGSRQRLKPIIGFQCLDRF